MGGREEKLGLPPAKKDEGEVTKAIKAAREESNKALPLPLDLPVISIQSIMPLINTDLPYIPTPKSLKHYQNPSSSPPFFFPSFCASTCFWYISAICSPTQHQSAVMKA
jgi:hypothetical protein